MHPFEPENQQQKVALLRRKPLAPLRRKMTINSNQSARLLRTDFPVTSLI